MINNFSALAVVMRFISSASSNLRNQAMEQRGSIHNEEYQ
jgi:hypothetical protein